MADLSVVAAQISPVFPDFGHCEIYNVVLAEAVTKGQILYQTTSGTFGVATAGTGAKDEPRGVALEAGAAGQVISMLVRGMLYGVTLTGLNADALLYLSASAGGLFATDIVAEKVGRIWSLNDPSKTKVVFVDCPVRVDYN